MAFVGRKHVIEQQVERYREARKFARAGGQTETDQGLQRLSNELEQWENRLDLQEAFLSKQEWD